MNKKSYADKWDHWTIFTPTIAALRRMKVGQTYQTLVWVYKGNEIVQIWHIAAFYLAADEWSALLPGLEWMQTQEVT